MSTPSDIKNKKPGSTRTKAREGNGNAREGHSHGQRQINEEQSQINEGQRLINEGQRLINEAQSKINAGQRQINGGLCEVDYRIIKVVETLLGLLEKSAVLEKGRDIYSLKDAIKEVRATIYKVAEIRPPGCDAPPWETLYLSYAPQTSSI